MIPDQYVVVQRGGKWWISFDANRFGPYVSRDIAVTAAVALAKYEERSGQESEVSWDDPDDGMPTLYKSAKRETGNVH